MILTPYHDLSSLLSMHMILLVYAFLSALYLVLLGEDVIVYIERRF